MSSPKLRKPERQETFFDDAISLQPVPGSKASFSANIPWDWASNIAAHGGFTASLMMAAARKYFQVSHPTRSQPDPISSSFNYLFPVPFGPAILYIQELSLGSKCSTIQVSLQGQVIEKGRPIASTSRVCVLATIIMGNLATENGITLPTTRMLRKEDLPKLEDCIENIRPEQMRKIFPIVFKTHRWLVSDPHQAETLEERSVRGLWNSRSDGNAWDVLSMGLMCDLISPTPHGYFHPIDQVKWGLWWPTLSMSLEIKRDPKNCKYIFMKLVTHEIRNGRFDTDVFAYNEEGDLVALARHVSQVREPAKTSPEYEAEKARILKL